MSALIHTSVSQNFIAQAFNFALPLLAVTQWGVSGSEGTWQVLRPSGFYSRVKGVQLAAVMHCSPGRMLEVFDSVLKLDHPYGHIGFLTWSYFGAFLL